MSIEVDQVAFRGALGRFASGVTVVTVNVSGVDHAMTASAFSSVSLEPPLVLLCVDEANRFHDAIMDTRRWAISILNETGRQDSAWFATRGRPLENQFGDIAHHRSPGGLALLDNSLAWLECDTEQAVEAGDHKVLIGRVRWAAVNESGDDPLLYYRSHYGTIVRSPESEKTLMGRPS